MTFIIQIEVPLLSLTMSSVTHYGLIFFFWIYHTVKIYALDFIALFLCSNFDFVTHIIFKSPQ